MLAIVFMSLAALILVPMFLTLFHVIDPSGGSAGWSSRSSPSQVAWVWRSPLHMASCRAHATRSLYSSVRHCCCWLPACSSVVHLVTESRRRIRKGPAHAGPLMTVHAPWNSDSFKESAVHLPLPNARSRIPFQSSLTVSGVAAFIPAVFAAFCTVLGDGAPSRPGLGVSTHSGPSSPSTA